MSNGKKFSTESIQPISQWDLALGILLFYLYTAWKKHFQCISLFWFITHILKPLQPFKNKYLN